MKYISCRIIMGENVIDNRKKALDGYSKIDPDDASNFSGIWNNYSGKKFPSVFILTGRGVRALKPYLFPT